MNDRRSNPPAKSVSQPAPSDETLQRFLAVQEQRLALELKQADLAIREVDHNQKIADKSIEAQAEDRKDERRLQKTLQKQRLIFAGIVTTAALAFVLIALWMNKDAIILDVLKVVMGFVGGWGASAVWRSQKQHDE